MIDSFLTLILVAGFAVYAWFVARVTRDRLERKNAALERRLEKLEQRVDTLEKEGILAEKENEI